VVRDDDVGGRHGGPLGDADQLLVQAGVVALEHGEVRVGGAPDRGGVGEPADLGAEIGPDRGERLDLAAEALAVDAAPLARGLARRQLEGAHG
jgi:hypothetical protein